MTDKERSHTTKHSQSEKQGRVKVDNIIQDMLTKSSVFKSTKLYDFYDSSWSNVNWGICGPSTATSNTDSTPSVSDSDSSSWLSSLDFLKGINLSRTLTNSNNMKQQVTTGEVPGPESGGVTVYDRIGALSNQLVYENRVVTAISKEITEVRASFLLMLRISVALDFWYAAHLLLLFFAHNSFHCKSGNP
jgi:hypothetical protein